MRIDVRNWKFKWIIKLFCGSTLPANSSLPQLTSQQTYQTYHVCNCERCNGWVQQPLKFANKFALGFVVGAPSNCCLFSKFPSTGRPLTFANAQGNNWRESWNVIIRQIKGEYKIANSAKRVKMLKTSTWPIWAPLLYRTILLIRGGTTKYNNWDYSGG